MSEEIEPVEHAQEQIHEHSHASKEPWIGWVALTAALLAALAAISSSLSGHHESEGVLERVRASDQWAYFQAKGMKQQGLETRIALYEVMGKDVPPKLTEKIAEYEKERQEIKEKASEQEKSSEQHMKLHESFSRAVTFSQIAIAVAAISMLTKRRSFWYVSLVLGALGLFMLINGLIV